MDPTPATSQVPQGQLAAVVTCYEMLKRPNEVQVSNDNGLQLALHRKPDLDWYLGLYRHVGSDWLWSWRLSIPRDDLSRIIHDDRVEVYALQHAGKDEGLLELDFRVAGECEINLFGISAALIGTGAGRWMMNQAKKIAWSRNINRFWLHTCSLDHPAAPSFYARSGFVPYHRYIEYTDDPRNTGVLPIDAGKHVPLIVNG